MTFTKFIGAEKTILGAEISVKAVSLVVMLNIELALKRYALQTKVLSYDQNISARQAET